MTSTNTMLWGEQLNVVRWPPVVTFDSIGQHRGRSISFIYTYDVKHFLAHNVTLQNLKPRFSPFSCK